MTETHTHTVSPALTPSHTDREHVTNAWTSSAVYLALVVVVDVSGVWWVKTKFHWGYLFIAAVHAHGACTAKATTDTHTHTHVYV